ncbi:MAG: efflux RND transporter periplasmic adaptor subunit [Ignavibacteriaceae bacterium]|nr:efflux RND transporter periplasmic adaptor subunit [Ignavibacteriaceae bacterium]
MFKYHKILFPFTLSLLVIITSCGDEKQIEEKIRPVRYAEVITGGSGTMRVFTGTAKTGIESKLSFKVGGTIKNINVKVGDFVNKGAVIAVLDDTDYKIKVKEAEAGLKQAESQALNTKNNYERVKTLYETNSISKSELDGARAQYESATANVEGMRSTLEYARLQLSYTRLLAPESGSIAVCNSESNENVQVGQIIAILIVGKDMEIELGIPENVINRIQTGMNVSITFPSLNNNFNGLVSEVSPSIDVNSSTYLVSVKILNPTIDVKSGMAANVIFEFEGSSSNDQLVVPVAAVGEDSDGRFVFLVVPEDETIASIKKQHIQIGDLTSEGFEVVSGLSLNQKVATAGLQSLIDGQKVRIN